jgi:DNA-binding transcriptional LysR family regulator
MEGAMELRHLRYFIGAAKEGSLTLAAEKVCTRRSRPSVAKSAISNTKSAFR